VDRIGGIGAGERVEPTKLGQTSSQVLPEDFRSRSFDRRTHALL
jgi:hypothetical protein